MDVDAHTIIDLKDACYSYPQGGPVLNGLDFKLEHGSKIGLIGDNGSGKTTFLHALIGLLKLSSGTLRVHGKTVETEEDFRKVRRKIGLLFQNPEDQLFCPTVLDDVSFGPLNLGKSPAEAREISVNTLKMLNLESFENRLTFNLSGGEKKLVALATVLAMKPDVLLLDEPTTALDETTRDHLIEILNDLETNCIIVSHEYEFLAATTQDIFLMHHGKIMYDGESSTLHYHYHRHPSGKAAHTHS